MQVIIYSTTTCLYCKLLKDYLSEKNVPFIERQVDQDVAIQEEMSKASRGFMGVPFTVIVKSDNLRETVVGFDKGRIDQILGM